MTEPDLNDTPQYKKKFRYDYFFCAMAAMILTFLLILPLTGSAVFRLVLERKPVQTCVFDLPKLSKRVCGTVGVKTNHCLKTLMFLPAKQECFNRRDELDQCLRAKGQE